MNGMAVIPRYLIVGATCASLNIVILMAGEALQAPLALSMAASFVLVGIVGYRLHSAISFTAPVSGRGFLRYMLASAVNVPASSLLLWLFARVLEWPMALAASTVTALMLVFNFFAGRHAILSARRMPGTWR